MARRASADPNATITYVRVSTDEQMRSGLGLEAQRAKVRREVDHRGWILVAEHADEGVSAKTVSGRPGLTAALEALDAGAAANLVVAKLDRLSRSVHDFTGLMDRSARQGWNLVVLDLGLDTTTPNGKFMAHIMAAVAQLEREIIGQRTSDALQAKIAQGVTLGRPERADAAVVARVAALRAEGASFRTIADRLTAERVPTAQGGARWYPSTARAVARRAAG